MRAARARPRSQPRPAVCGTVQRAHPPPFHPRVPSPATNHTGFCVESAPSLGAGQLSDAATSISIALSVPAVSIATDCAVLFTSTTSAQLGRRAMCAVDAATGGTELRILLRVRHGCTPHGCVAQSIAATQRNARPLSPSFPIPLAPGRSCLTFHSQSAHAHVRTTERAQHHLGR